MRLAVAVATLGGVGRLRPAPGSWASAAVLPAVLLGPLPCLLLALLLAAAGFWAVRALGPAARGDPPWVVVDEGAGQLLALAALPAGAGLAGALLAFALFRALDILKPGPVGWADRRPGTAGVMLDDLVAGALAGAAILLLRLLWPGVPL
ncbi:phosphatidylglycerophosphatase A family protein [Crenalkalicoccus roseus]|uniref:phosphatidylglycerophosphatase A family protein n=1 Tax=Crenalkalicoccus roseus TaxID=1485588 RepID=UPI0010806EE6|nr:phosphatidylglycerophosphatase A [Crenalkalicoccus roseus]